MLNNSKWTTVANQTSSTSVTLSNLTPGAKYSFRAQTTNYYSQLTGPFGAEVDYIVKNLPGSTAAPTVGDYQALANVVVISWAKPYDDGGNANLAYMVQYSGDGILWNVLASDLTNLSISAGPPQLSFSSVYYFRVCAILVLLNC